MNRIEPALSRCADTQQRTLLATACHAALTAGQMIKQHFACPHSITMKGAINLVTETDLAAEALIIAALRAATPEIPILAEESPAPQHTADRLWVVDPLDGTTNFAHGFPFFAVSIALLDQGVPTVAAIYAPMLDELFCARRGGGAWLNAQAIAVSRTQKLIEALVGTGFPYDIEHTLPQVMRQLAMVLAQVRDVRRAGAAALDLAYVACGRLDGFYEINLQPWDTAAGWLLVEEAGGMLTDFSGGSYSPFIPQVAASNGTLHAQLLQHLS